MATWSSGLTADAAYHGEPRGCDVCSEPPPLVRPALIVSRNRPDRDSYPATEPTRVGRDQRLRLLGQAILVSRLTEPPTPPGRGPRVGPSWAPAHSVTGNARNPDRHGADPPVMGPSSVLSEWQVRIGQVENMAPIATPPSRHRLRHHPVDTRCCLICLSCRTTALSARWVCSFCEYSSHIGAGDSPVRDCPPSRARPAGRSPPAAQARSTHLDGAYRGRPRRFEQRLEICEHGGPPMRIPSSLALVGEVPHG